VSCITQHKLGARSRSSEALTRVIGAEPEDDVAIVGHSDRVLSRRQIELSVEKTSPIEIQGMLQVNLLYVPVWGSAHTDDIEGVTVQVEGMTQVWLLNCKYNSWYGTEWPATAN
jgi:hypothetical protein